MSTSLIAVFIPILLMGGHRRPAVPRVRRRCSRWRSRSPCVVSLTTTPMMCARFLEVEGRGARPARTALTERAFDALAAALRPEPRAGCCAIRGSTARSPPSLTIGAQRVSLHHRAQGLLPPAGHRPAHREHPGRPGHLVPGHEREDEPSSSTIGRRRPRRLPVVAFTGGSGNHHEYRAHVRLAQAARASARPRPTRSSTACAASSRTSPAPTLFLQAVQDLRIGGRMSNAQYQYTLQSNDLAELESLRAAHARQAAGAAARCATWPPTSRTAGCRPRS